MNTPVSLGRAFASNNATSVTITGVNADVGDLVIVDAGNDGGHVPTGVTDSAGNAYAADVTPLFLADNYAPGRFSCVVTSALVNGTITVAFAGISGIWDKWAAAVKVAPVVAWDENRVDQVSRNTGSGTAWSSGATPATTEADELVYGLAQHAPTSAANTSTPAAGYTEVFDVNNSTWSKYTSAYKVVSATGAQTASGTWTASGGWAAYVVTYKEQATSGPQQVSIVAAAEADAAQPVAVSKPIRQTLAPASEQDAGQGFAATKRLAVASAAETDAAAALAYAKPIRAGFAPAAESDAAQPLDVSHPGAFSLAPAATVDTALALDFAKPIHVALAPADELDTTVALNLSGPTRVTLVAASEAESALSLPVVKQLAVDAAQTLGVALLLAPSKVAALAPAAEIDFALPAAYMKTIHVGLVAALETDTARTFSVVSPGFVLHPRSGAETAPREAAAAAARTADPVSARLGGA